MKTNAKIVSGIRNQFRQVAKDPSMPRRMILDRARMKAAFLINQKLEQGRLLDESIYTEIKCLELEPSNIVDCPIVSLRKCNQLMKSKTVLPSLLAGRYGPEVLLVQNLSGNINYTKSTEVGIGRDTGRTIYGKSDQSKYYIGSDNYLYIPDTEVEVVRVVLLTLSPEDVNINGGCETCDDGCESVWDQPFKCPEGLLDIVVQQLERDFGTYYMSVTPDENPNLNENER